MNKLKVGMIGVDGYRRERMRGSGLFELVAVTDRNKDRTDQSRYCELTRHDL